MSRRRHIAVVVLAVALVTSGWPLDAWAAEDGHEVSARDDSLDARAAAATGQFVHDSRAPASPYEWLRRNLCWAKYPVVEESVSDTCASNGVLYDTPPVCESGEALQPLWRRLRGTQTWLLQVGWHCPESLRRVVTQEDFQQVVIPPPVAHSQPEGGKVLVNKETIVYTEADVQRLRTDVLGFGFDIEVTPVRYSWDFGDGSDPLVTRSKGHPYPGFELYHVYDMTGPMQISLTTTWRGRYRLDDDPPGIWHDVQGTATTTSLTQPFELIERRTHLVSP